MNDLLLKLHATMKSLLARADGQSLTEYGMAFSLIALGCVAGESAVAHSVNQTFIAMATTITTNVVR
jgi:Flp pilus assembly pilin Flp